MMKKLILNTVASILFLSTSALAYDVDTHFYGTYSMARFAGIRHEVAVKIATGAQWMDESYISDPLSMIILPDVGIKKRRLLHFPGPRETVSFDPNKLPSFLDPSTGEPLNLKLFTETVADDPFASEMITEGLLTGNLMMVSTGIHTLEDSFAHAGTIAELGHAHFWHHPDRPYVDEESVQKYFKMTTEVLKVMVAIRTLLPSNGLDYDLQLGERKNFQMSSAELAQAYKTNQKIVNTVSYNVLKDSRYVAEALKFLFAKAYVAGYIIDDINFKDAKGLVKKHQYSAYLNKFTKGQDAYEAGVSVARAMPSNLLNLPKILKDTTGRTTLTTDDIKSFGGMGALYAKTLHPFLSGFVPRALDEYHKFEKENDTDPAGKAIYDKENEVRNNNMSALIVNLYKNDIIFKKNPLQAKADF